MRGDSPLLHERRHLCGMYRAGLGGRFLQRLKGQLGDVKACLPLPCSICSRQLNPKSPPCRNSLCRAIASAPRVCPAAPPGSVVPEDRRACGPDPRAGARAEAALSRVMRDRAEMKKERPFSMNHELRWKSADRMLERETSLELATSTWQGCALPTELLPRFGWRRRHADRAVACAWLSGQSTGIKAGRILPEFRICAKPRAPAPGASLRTRSASAVRAAPGASPDGPCGPACRPDDQ